MAGATQRFKVAQMVQATQSHVRAAGLLDVVYFDAVSFA